MTSSRTIGVAAVAIAAGLVGWLSFQWFAESRSAGTDPYGVAFSLVDHRGEPITEAALYDKPAALFFGFTHCPEVCPTTLYELDGWMRAADPDGSAINAFFVSVDPERDTPAVLGDYVTSVSDRIVGITGDPQDVAGVVKGFNIYAKKVPLDGEDGDYTMDHTASVLLLEEGGRFRSSIAYGENPETAVQKLKNLISG